MTVGFYKRLLALLNVIALVLLGGTAWGFLSHRKEMKEEFKAPVFGAALKIVPVTVTDVSAISIPLGLFPKHETPQATEPVKEQPKEDIEDVIRKLGEIKNAFVVYPPYGPTKPVPSILFEFRKDDTRRVIALGDGLVERKDPDPEMAQAGIMVPERYEFVGCIPDPDHPGWTCFQFRLDPSDPNSEIQLARWKGETEEKPLIDAAAAPVGDKNFSAGGGMVVYTEAELKRRREAREARQPETAPAQPGQPEPTAPVSPAVPAGTRLVQPENGAITMTEEGAAYLRDHYEDVLREVAFESYQDRDTGRTGVLVRRITGDRAAQFGIRPDDVILSINNVPVRDQNQAVNVVKRELNKASPPRYIEVRILRNGREITERYDTQDPELRKRARDLRRG